MVKIRWPDEDDDVCACEFAPGECLYSRTCTHCGREWLGLHCVHDGYQNPCPGCEVRPEPQRTR